MNICIVENCTRNSEKTRKKCSLHRQRWKKFKSHELPNKPDILPGYVKACRIHGQLKQEDCLITKRQRAKVYKNTTWNIYQCKKCTHERYDKWRSKHPNSRKEEYDARKHTKSTRDKYHEIRLKKLYGMTREDYNKKFESQKGLCAICLKPESKTDARYGRTIRLAVDHCHKTGKNRDLLCSRCNTRAGGSDDEIPLLQATIDYIRRHSSAD